MAVLTKKLTSEPAPFSGDLRLKVWWKSNDYDRVHEMLVAKVDVRGSIVYNLTQVGYGEYKWEPVDQSDYSNQLQPLLQVSQETMGPLYQSIQDHLVTTGYMAPPTTTNAEDVERKMLKAENTFLKELVQEMAGTRKRESWHTTSIEDQTNEKLDKMMEVIDKEIQRREDLGTTRGPGTPTISGATGSTGHGGHASHFESKGLSGRANILIHPDIQNPAAQYGSFVDGETYEQYQANSGQGDSEDRG